MECVSCAVCIRVNVEDMCIWGCREIALFSNDVVVGIEKGFEAEIIQ